MLCCIAFLCSVLVQGTGADSDLVGTTGLENNKTFHTTTNILADTVFLDTVFIQCVNDLSGFVFTDTLTVMDSTYQADVITDTTDIASDICTGKDVVRIWTTVSMGDTTPYKQIVAVKDDLPIDLMVEEVHDTIGAEERLSPRYEFGTWVNEPKLMLSLNVVANLGANCTSSFGIASDNDLDTSFLSICETRFVTFTISDDCQNPVEWTASLTTIDTVPPQIIGIRDTSMLLTCKDPDPEIPTGIIAVDTVYDLRRLPITAVSYDTVGIRIDTLSMDNIEIVTEINDTPASCDTLKIIRRIFIAEDSCGNRDSVRMNAVKINIAPEIILPFTDTLITCQSELDSLPAPEFVAGCTEDFTVSVSDTIRDSICVNQYRIERVWRVDDVCNSIFGIQNITIRDTVPPSFEIPADTIVSDQASFIALQREDIFNVTDNCSGLIDTLLNGFEDVEESGPVCDRTVRRPWALQDVCGNISDTLVQTIIVRDTIAPVFTATAMSDTIYCSRESNLDTLFSNWIDNYGGASAEDAFADTIIWNVVYADSGLPVEGFEPIECMPDSNKIIKNVRVNFIISDECENADTTTASFVVFDTLAPQIVFCGSDTIQVSTDSMSCEATYVFNPPIIEENCIFSPQLIRRSDEAMLTFDTTQGLAGDVSVDPLTLRIPIPLPVDLDDGGTLTIALEGIDGEQLTEFFSVYGEADLFLGRTNNTSAQCDSSVTSFEISKSLLQEWSVDGEITIFLDPNIPDGLGGRDAINAICEPAGKVRATIEFSNNASEGLFMEYRVNGGDTVLLDPIRRDTLNLGLGVNAIDYYVYDCAGNVDSCTLFIDVVDDIAPILECPSDTVLTNDPDTCLAVLTLPLPTGATDNCAVIGQFERTFPLDTASAFFSFTKDSNLDDFLADDKTFIFTGITPSAIGEVNLEFRFRGNFDDVGAFVRFFDENNNLISRTNLGDAACEREGVVILSFPADTFNIWAEDGIVTFSARVNDINVPPGIPGDGVNPCRPELVEEDGDIDSVSYMFATLTYGELRPSYFATGATEISLMVMDTAGRSSTHDFNLGVTEVFYTLRDVNGNEGQCSFTVTVEDTQEPEAICQPTTLFVNPSGLDQQIIDAAEIDNGSNDNCGIEKMTITPNTFDCEDAGDTTLVMLTVTDIAGNQASCRTIVRVETLKPEPTANSGLCGSDTLFLFSNPPPAQGGIVYTYEWTGPNGFTSNLQNPIIPNVDSDNAGSYTVEITGITGCSSRGSVEVAIEDLPLTPSIAGNNQLCVTDDIVINSTITPAGSFVNYRWYFGELNLGIAPDTITTNPILTIPGPHPEAIQRFYLVLEVEGCVSQASLPYEVRTTNVPEAVVREEFVNACEGESVELAAEVFGTGITYSWEGPNDFSSTKRVPVIEGANVNDAGTYSLIVSNFGCASAVQNVEVVILDTPEKPIGFANSPICIGQTLRLQPNLTNDQDIQYVWVRPDGTSQAPGINFEDTAKRQYEGNWRVIAQKNGCESPISDPVSVFINARPEVVATAETLTPCEGGELELIGLSDVANTSFRWSGPLGFFSGEQNPEVDNFNNDRQGVYTLIGTTLAGCRDTANIEIGMNQRPVITAVSNDGTDCLLGPTDITLAATIFPESANLTYQWTGPNGFVSTEEVALLPNATANNNGTYRLVVTDQNGCISAPRVTQVDVSDPPVTPLKPFLSDGFSLPACRGGSTTLETSNYNSGEVVYNWITPMGTITTSEPTLALSPLETTQSGEYTVFVTVNGCPSRTSGIFNLEVLPRTAAIVDFTDPICEGDNLTFNVSGQSVPVAEYRWTGPNFSSSLQNPTIEDVTRADNEGVYRVAFTAINGCTSGLSFSISILESPAPPELAGDDAICLNSDGAVLNLEATANLATGEGTYFFEDPFGQVFERDRNQLSISDFSQYEDGIYEFTVRVQEGLCTSKPSEPFVVSMDRAPVDQKAFAGDDLTVCSNESVTLNAEMPAMGTGTWSLASDNGENFTITNPSSPTTNINGLVGGETYILNWTLSNGACRNYDSDELVVNVEVGENAVAGMDMRLCGASEVNLQATPAISGSGFWSQPGNQEFLGVVIEDPSNPNTQISGLQLGNIYQFTWTVESDCGSSSDEIFISISDPAAFAGFDQVICNENGVAMLNADEPTGGSNGRWYSIDSTREVVFANVTRPITEVRNLGTGVNQFVWELDDGLCGDSGRDTVEILYQRNPIATPDLFFIEFDQATEINVLTNDEPRLDSSLTIINGPSSGTLEEIEMGRFVYTPDPNFVGDDRFTYELCSASCECATTEVILEVGKDAPCKIPNIITPNNDGINDAFVVPCLFDESLYPQSQVFIFNQWGDEVYRSDVPYKNDWKGTFNGEDLPVGVYFYIVDFFERREEPVEGYMYIQR